MNKEEQLEIVESCKIDIKDIFTKNEGVEINPEKLSEIGKELSLKLTEKILGEERDDLVFVIEENESIAIKYASVYMAGFMMGVDMSEEDHKVGKLISPDGEYYLFPHPTTGFVTLANLHDVEEKARMIKEREALKNAKKISKKLKKEKRLAKRNASQSGSTSKYW